MPVAAASFWTQPGGISFTEFDGRDDVAWGAGDLKYEEIDDHFKG